MQQPPWGPPQGPMQPGPYGQQPMQQPPMQQAPTQQPHQGYGAPMQHAPAAPPPTVWGTQLGPGERVIYFHRRDGTVEKWVLIIAGIILAVGIVGLIFLIIGIMAKPEAWVVTNHRIMHINQGKPADFVVATQVKQVYKKLGGTAVKWLNLVDAHGRKVDLQCTCNPPGYADMIERYLQNPALLEQAPPVPYEA